MEPITYATSPAGLQQDGRLLRVPAGLATKQALLAWFAGALPLPGYATANWDSLEECLTDLSWMPQRRIVLFHEDMPLAGDAAAQAIYVSILDEAARNWMPDPAHDLIVTFPPENRPMVERLAARA